MGNPLTAGLRDPPCVGACKVHRSPDADEGESAGGAAMRALFARYEEGGVRVLCDSRVEALGAEDADPRVPPIVFPTEEFTCTMH